MNLRTFSYLLLIVGASALLFITCQKRPEVASTDAAVTGYHWPPDTMSVTLVGNGHLKFKAAWKLRAAGGTVAEPVIYDLLGVITPPDTTAGKILKHTPSDTTAAGLVKAIVDRPRSVPPKDALLLVKWIPDTTGGK